MKKAMKAMKAMKKAIKAMKKAMNAIKAKAIKVCVMLCILSFFGMQHFLIILVAFFQI